MIYCISGKIADVCNCSLSRYPTQKSACIGKEQGDDQHNNYFGSTKIIMLGNYSTMLQSESVAP